MSVEDRDAARRVVSALFGPDEALDLDEDVLSQGQAYLTGVLVEMLAASERTTVAEIVDRLRRHLGDGGDDANDRVPRRPLPGSPPRAAEESAPS